MNERFEKRRKQLLADAEIKSAVYAGILDRLPQFLEPYAKSLRLMVQRKYTMTYMRGLLSNTVRKNVESIAYLNDQDRHELQHFIGGSPWDVAPLLEQLIKDVGGELGESDAILVFDPSGFEKDGKDSVGVQRQWLGRLGKVENGQVGVYLGYVSRRGYALCDVQLYLPQEWIRDRKRRRKSGVPKEICFRTKQQMALDMLAQRRMLLPHGWIAGDDEMGRSARFRGDLRALGERYLLDVPSNTLVRDLEVLPPAYHGSGRKPRTLLVSVTRWCEKMPESAWTTVQVRDGEKGPLYVQILKRRVQTRTEDRHVGPEELLVVMRTMENSGWRMEYHLSNASADTPLEELARVGKEEHRIEDCLKRAKSEAGLADYEVRHWVGWHHHQILSLMATWFLTVEANRGKKMDSGNHGSADTDSDGRHVA
jgi:SRSO17 transposase